MIYDESLLSRVVFEYSSKWFNLSVTNVFLALRTRMVDNSTTGADQGGGLPPIIGKI